MEYQDVIYKIALYLKPLEYSKYKSECGMKQLANQVIELNQIIYFDELHNNIQNYYITDKIDGNRTILYLTSTYSFAVNDKLESLNIITKDICILDTEKYVIDNDTIKYYIFDVMVYNGKSLINEPFKKRLEYFDKFITYDCIITKPFIKLNNDYKVQISRLKNEKKKYDTDGIIFTPSDGLYDTMKVYKYKPPSHMTIDFLIKKCPPEIISYYHFSERPHKTLYILFCGISKMVFYKLRLYLLKSYDKIFPNINTKNLPNYFPIQFIPNNKKNVYLYWDLNNNLDNKIGEFIYDISSEEWKLLRIREDRQIEINRGNYFGNNYKVAEYVWISHKNPLIIENINDEPMMYLQRYYRFNDTVNAYINNVKLLLYEEFKNVNNVVDLDNGDLLLYAYQYFNNVVFLCTDYIAVMDVISKKHLFSNNKKYRGNMNIVARHININNPHINKHFDLFICGFTFCNLIYTKELLESTCGLLSNLLNKKGKLILFLINYNNVKGDDNDDENIIGKKITIKLHNKSINYTEYVVDINIIINELKKNNIVLIKNGSFSKFITNNNVLSVDDKKMIDLYNYYIFEKL